VQRNPKLFRLVFGKRFCQRQRGFSLRHAAMLAPVWLSRRALMSNKLIVNSVQKAVTKSEGSTDASGSRNRVGRSPCL
jgi:hypothetical protein